MVLAYALSFGGEKCYIMFLFLYIMFSAVHVFCFVLFCFLLPSVSSNNAQVQPVTVIRSGLVMVLLQSVFKSHLDVRSSSSHLPTRMISCFCVADHFLCVNLDYFQYLKCAVMDQCTIPPLLYINQKRTIKAFTAFISCMN